MMSGLQCQGVGSSKKAAKKEAADKMLSILQEDGECCDVVDAPQVDFALPSSFLRLFTLQIRACLHDPT